MRHLTHISVFLCLAGVLAGSVQATEAPARVAFDIEAQPLKTALNVFSRQSGLQVMLKDEEAPTAGVTAPKVAGSLSIEEALSQLLARSALKYEFLNERTVRITASDLISRAAAVKQMTLAQNEKIRSEGSTENPDADPQEKLQEVIVTGSHIRGAAPVGSNIITIDRAEIEQNGYATAFDIVKSLPQNFSGGLREDLNGATGRGAGGVLTPDASNNVSQANGVNLRGLGSTGTLVLVNGRRLTLSGLQGSSTDTSSIPASAIERVEVLPDGASALYGSDAIGGVVNFILKKHYDGAETMVRGGAATQGGLTAIQASQILGHSWQSGEAILSLDYSKRAPLRASDRDEITDDLRRFGGDNFSQTTCNPGNIVVGGVSYAIPANQNGTALTPASFVSGTRNLCNSTNGSDAFPEIEKLSGFLSLSQNLTNRWSLFADVAAARRQNESAGANKGTLTVPLSNAFYVNPTGGTGAVSVQYDFLNDFGPSKATYDVKNYGFTLGANVDAGHDWRINGYVAEVSERDLQRQILLSADPVLLAAALADSSRLTAFNPFGAGSNTNVTTLAALRQTRKSRFDLDAQTRSANVVADGPLFNLPGGTLRAALGADVRREEFESSSVTLQPSVANPVPVAFASNRRVSAAFGEIAIPLVGPMNAVAGMKRLDLSFATRHERYDDVGSVTVPRVGLSWSPGGGLTVRSTWSESFKAPAIRALSEANNASIIQNIPGPSGGAVAALRWVGTGNQDLVPETAKTWTAGLDFESRASGNLRLSLTYFNLDDRNRIQGLPSTNLLTDPANASAVFTNPSAELRQRACSGLFAGNLSSSPGTCLSAPIYALVDERIRNIAIIREDGVDFSGSYTFGTPLGTVNAGLQATYLLAYDIAASPEAAVLERANTPANPLELKARAFAGISHGQFTVGSSVNFSNAYEDIFAAPARHIDHWLTMDLNLSYSLPETNFLGMATVSMHITNLFDSAPPFYNNANGIAYDAQNADVIGRTVSVVLRKTW